MRPDGVTRRGLGALLDNERGRGLFFHEHEHEHERENEKE